MSPLTHFAWIVISALILVYCTWIGYDYLTISLKSGETPKVMNIETLEQEGPQGARYIKVTGIALMYNPVFEYGKIIGTKTPQAMYYPFISLPTLKGILSHHKKRPVIKVVIHQDEISSEFLQRVRTLGNLTPLKFVGEREIEGIVRQSPRSLPEKIMHLLHTSLNDQATLDPQLIVIQLNHKPLGILISSLILGGSLLGLVALLVIVVILIRRSRRPNKNSLSQL